MEIIGDERVIKIEDYSTGINGLPKSDVLKFFYQGEDADGSVVIRPSGTEPKLKVYVSVTAKDRLITRKVEAIIVKDIEQKLQ